MVDLAARLEGLQDALYAEATVGPEDGGGTRSVLLVLQGMDTSGKGGVIRHVAGLVNPQGLHIASFKKPTAEERAHHFLWRIRKETPQAGQIGVFDRSHYEDVLIARVDSLVPEDVWRGRYDEINAFEAELAAQDVTSRPRPSRNGCSRGSTIRSSTGSTTSPTSTRDRSGPPTRRPTPTHCGSATPTPRPGTSSRRTASGTATGPWRPCSPRPSPTWNRSSRRPTSTSTPSGRA